MHPKLLDRKLDFLGIAKNAGKIALGDEAVSASAKKGTAKLIISAIDASESTKRKAERYAAARNTEYFVSGWTKEQLGAKFGRRSVAMLALLDAGIAKSLTNKIESRNQTEEMNGN